MGHNEHHFYHQAGRKHQQIEPLTGSALPSNHKRFDQACERLAVLMPKIEYQRFLYNEVGGSWDEMISTVEAEIMRRKAAASLDILADFRETIDVNTIEDCEIDDTPMGGY